MKFIDTEIEGVKIIIPIVHEDNRGLFLKIYNKSEFNQVNQESIEEIFYSKSVKNVIRGFHFQLPPYDLEKFVWVTEGEILDVFLDLRSTSSTYGLCSSYILSEQNKNIIYFPKGIAHAFLCLSNSSTVFYATSKIFSNEHDAGIRWNSVNFDWPSKKPIISIKDQNLPLFLDFSSPF